MAKIVMNKRTNARELSNKSAAINNELYTNFNAEIDATVIEKLSFAPEKTLQMTVNAFLKQKIDPVTKTSLDVGVVSTQQVIATAMSIEVLNLRAQGIEGTDQESIECERILRTYFNSDVVKKGLGSGVRYESINKYGKNMMLAEYSNQSNCRNVLNNNGEIYANIKMMLFKTGTQQANMFSAALENMDFSAAKIKDIIKMTMDVQHISRNVQETSIDMDKKVDLIVGFTLGRVLNKNLIAAATVLKNNVRFDENGNTIEVVTTNVKEIKKSATKEFAVDINLGEEVVKDYSVITANALSQGATKAVNEEFMGIYENSYTLQIVQEACAMANRYADAANEIADLYNNLLSYDIATNMEITNDLTTVQMDTDEDKELVRQGVKNSIVEMQKVVGLNNRDFTLLVWGAACRTEISVNNKSQKVFDATAEKRYARDLFREQILSIYASTNVDGTVDTDKELLSDSIVVSPTIATASALEADETLSFEVRFEGNDIIDIATDKKIAIAPVLLDGVGYVEKVEGKVRAVKKIELTDKFEVEGDVYVAPLNMVCLNNAIAVNYRAVRSEITEQLEAQIAADIKAIKDNFIGSKELLLVNGVHHNVDYGVITTNKKGELVEIPAKGVFNALGYIDYAAQDVKAVATLNLGLVGRLSNIHTEEASALYAYGMTDKQGLLGVLATNSKGRYIDLVDVKYFEGKALALYKRA